jgi:hypothetical protein
MNRSKWRLRTQSMFFAWVLWLAVAPLAVLAQSPTVLLDESRTIGQTNTAVARDFDVVTAGDYELRFTDLGVPGAFASYRVAVTRGANVVATLDSPATTQRFTATAGTYGVRVIGAPGGTARSGTFGARVVSVASNAAVLDFADVIQAVAAAPAATTKNFETTFEILTAGNYQLTLTDHSFPAAMNQVAAAVLREGAPQLSANLSNPGSAAFAATPGTYRVVASGTAGATRSAGLFSVRVGLASGGPARFLQTVDVGATQRLGSAALDAQAHSLVLTDFAVPSALASLSAIVTADGATVTAATAPGTIAFTPTAQQHELFTFGSAASAAAGSYGSELRRGTTVVLGGARTIAAGANGVAYTFTGDAIAAGRHTVQLTDFGFPLAFNSLRAAVVQGGSSLGSLNAGATALDVDLAVGPVSLLVFGQLNSGTNGLFGATVTPAATGARPLIEVTQGAGALFDVRRVDVTTPGRYEASVADLGFPASFTNLDVQISRGTQSIGTFFSGGSFIFNAATPGNYFVNFIARPGATSGGYGTYRLRVASAAPEPTVTLSVDPVSIVTGSTTRVRWSSTDATSCTASGGWSGTKTAAGEEVTGALSANTTFSLECVGPGGRKSAQATVTVNAPSASGGGGGAITLPAILALGGLVLCAARRRLRAA